MKTLVGHPDDRIRRSRLEWIAEVIRRPAARLADALRRIR